MNSMSAINNKRLRIASLLPSTTDICISLGLECNIVGITHECDFPSSSHPLYQSAAPPIFATSNHYNSPSHEMVNDINGNKKSALTLTLSHIDPHKHSQEEIDTAVKTSVCCIPTLYYTCTNFISYEPCSHYVLSLLQTIGT